MAQNKALNNIDMNGLLVKNLGSPVDDNDAITKAYLDPILEGTKWKPEGVRCVAQSNVNLASPGTTIDGLTLAQNESVLLPLQTNAEENGVYVFDTATTPLVRRLDCNTFEELIGATVVILEGTSENTSYRQTETSGTIDVDDNFWVQFGSATPDATELVSGKARIGTQAEVDAGTLDTVIVTPLKLTSYLSNNNIKKQVFNVGNNTNTTFTLNHNLNTTDIVYQAYFNVDDSPVFWLIVEPINTTSVTVRTAPELILGNDEIRVVLIG